jgi:hypothetical protein
MRALKKWTPISASVAQSSIEILPANGLRKFATINNSTSNGIWLGLGVAAVVGQGEYVPPGGSYIFDDDNLWQGAVNGISSSGTNVIGAGDWQ